MPAPLKIALTEEEERTLRELSYANGVPRRIKQRAGGLRLNASGWSVQQIAAVNFAIVRTIALNLFRHHGFASVTQGLRRMAHDIPGLFSFLQ